MGSNDHFIFAATCACMHALYKIHKLLIDYQKFRCNWVACSLLWNMTIECQVPRIRNKSPALRPNPLPSS